MLERLPRVPVDTFLLALLAVVTLAALFPATATRADVLDVATGTESSRRRSTAVQS
jgi:hypothetical protein